MALWKKWKAFISVKQALNKTLKMIFVCVVWLWKMFCALHESVFEFDVFPSVYLNRNVSYICEHMAVNYMQDLIKKRMTHWSFVWLALLFRDVPLAFQIKLTLCTELTKVYWGLNLHLASLLVGNTKQQWEEPVVAFEAESQEPCDVTAANWSLRAL